MQQFVKAGQIVLADQVVENGFMIIENGKFGAVSVQQPAAASAANTIDYANYIVAAGLVDTHIHGYQACDVMDNDLASLKAISTGLLAGGVTTWLPTTLTAATEELDAVCRTIGAHHSAVTGAKIRGIFLEGPFFTAKYKGAQNADYMLDPALTKLQKWLALSNGLVNKIALAPERAGAAAFINAATKLGVAVALGHSDATYEEAKQAVAAGANIFIHTYNAMSGLHQREPGMVGAALSLDTVYAEVICDNCHVHPAAVKILLNARGTRETVLVTDCMRAGGMGDGKFRLGEFDVDVCDGVARLADSGNLAGSVLELMTAVQNVVKWGLATPAEALRMASLVPAQSVNIADVCGQISPGYDADFIVVDQELNLQATYLNGKLRHQT